MISYCLGDAKLSGLCVGLISHSRISGLLQLPRSPLRGAECMNSKSAESARTIQPTLQSDSLEILALSPSLYQLSLGEPKTLGVRWHAVAGNTYTLVCKLICSDVDEYVERRGGANKVL